MKSVYSEMMSHSGWNAVSAEKLFLVFNFKMLHSENKIMKTIQLENLRFIKMNSSSVIFIISF